MPRETTARQPLCADIDGFSLHAAVRGQVELQLKTPWRDGTTHLVMSPLEFIQRLAALVPRPRLHLIRLHGVLAPNAKLRALGLRHRHAPLSELRRRGAPYHRRHPPAPGDREDPSGVPPKLVGNWVNGRKDGDKVATSKGSEKE